MTAARYGVLGLAAALAAGLAGYAALFGAFVGDDEGYVLISLHQNLAGAPIYDVVFTQYGPGFFVLVGGAFEVLGMEANHDNARLITLLSWTAACLLCGASLLRLTSSLPVALGGLLVAFYALTGMVYEPLHPGGTLSVLLAGIVAVAAFLVPRHASPAMLVIGGLIAAAALIKVNVGLLALLAVAFACSISVVPLRRVGAIRIGVCLLIAAAPLVLMGSSLSEEFVWRHALVVALAAIAVMIAASPLPAHLELRPAYALVVGIGAVTTVVLAVIFIEGTTVDGLIDGMVDRPLEFPDLVLSPTDLSPLAPLWGLLAVGAAALITWRRRSGADLPASVRRLMPAARIAAGLGIWVAVLRVGGADPATSAFGHDWHPESIGIVAPLAWVAAIPPRSSQASSHASFVRALIPILAVLQLLHPYPVPGTQVAWGIFLFAVVGGICVADGLAELPVTRAAGLGLPAPRLIGGAVVVAFVAIALALPIRDWANQVRTAYSEGTPVGLPGAERLRLPAQQAAELRDVAAEVRGSCSTFLGLPGFNSLYLFTGQEPPTGMNVGAWPILFDEEDQRLIVERVRGIDRLCVVRNEAAVGFFVTGTAGPSDPLVGFIQRRFKTERQIGVYQIMERTGSPR